MYCEIILDNKEKILQIKVNDIFNIIQLDLNVDYKDYQKLFVNFHSLIASSSKKILFYYKKIFSRFLGLSKKKATS